MTQATPIRRVIIVGAGPAGLVAARELRAVGIDCAIYDRSPFIGGRWAPVEHSFCYDSLESNVSRGLMAFSDLPVSADEPDFPRRARIHAYFADYAARHGLEAVIHLGHEVIDLSVDDPTRPDSGWTARVRSASSAEPRLEHFDGALICTGPYARPRWPAVDLDPFTGAVSHTAAYRRPAPFAGQRVLVVGGSSSAGDIAAELGGVAAEVTMAVRSPFWLMGKFDHRGRPSDHGMSRLGAALPDALRIPLETRAVSAQHRPLAEFGLPVPTTHVDDTRVVQAADLPAAIRAGQVKFRPGLAAVEGPEAVFADGSRLEVDHIICATGYRPDPMPWLDDRIAPPALRDPTRGPLALIRHVQSPTHPRLAFVGHVSVRGPGFPLMEMQARWIAARWSGRLAAVPDGPTPGTAASGPHAPLHTVHYLAYLDTLAGDIGCRPRVWRRLLTQPRLFARLMWGPLLPAMYRLDGPHRWDGAAAHIMDYRPGPTDAGRGAG